jgi:hypothetical protein
MNIDLSQINYIAVLVAAALFMGLGAFWYSPAGFLKPWMEALGMKTTDARPKSHPAKMMGATFISLLLACFVMAVLVQLTGSSTFVSGAILGLMTCLGFVFTTQLINSMFEGRNIGLLLVNIGYALVGFVMAGMLLSVWR